MKKKLLLIVVLLVCLSAVVVFAACNNESNKTPENSNCIIQYTDELGTHTINVENGV